MSAVLQYQFSETMNTIAVVGLVLNVRLVVRTPCVERGDMGSNPIHSTNMVSGAARCGYSPVTGEKQVGSNPTGTARIKD